MDGIKEIERENGTRMIELRNIAGNRRDWRGDGSS